MKKAAAVIFALSMTAAGAATARDYYVAPHVRSDGTYVQGHYRSAPDGNRFNNYSTQGNYNPYTGQMGTVNPYSQPLPQPRYTQPQYNPNSNYLNQYRQRQRTAEPRVTSGWPKQPN